MTSDDLHEILKQVWLRDISADDAFGDLEPVLSDLHRLKSERDKLRELLRDARDHTRHSDYDWDVDFARDVDRALGEG